MFCIETLASGSAFTLPLLVERLIQRPRMPFAQPSIPELRASSGNNYGRASSLAPLATADYFTCHPSLNRLVINWGLALAKLGRQLGWRGYTSGRGRERRDCYRNFCVRSRGALNRQIITRLMRQPRRYPCLPFVTIKAD